MLRNSPDNAASPLPIRGVVGTGKAMQEVYALTRQVAASNASVLLTGETGTGKTSLVQHLASLVGAHMVVVNLNQQSDSGDLLGGFKPVEVRQMAQVCGRRAARASGVGHWWC